MSYANNAGKMLALAENPPDPLFQGGSSFWKKLEQKGKEENYAGRMLALLRMQARCLRSQGFEPGG